MQEKNITQQQPQPRSVWVNLLDHFTEDWEMKHCRYVADKVKLDTDLFQLKGDHLRDKSGYLQKKSGTGRVELHEVEYLIESGAEPGQRKRRGAVRKYRRIV